MYKVVPISDLPGYKFGAGKWAIITPHVPSPPNTNTNNLAYKLMGASEYYSIVSTHATKGAADKACNKLQAFSIKKDVKEIDTSDKPYRLAITEKQARLIVDALDLYSRIGMGQLQEVAFVLRSNSFEDTIDFGILDKVTELLRKASSYWMNGSGGYHGIYSDKINDNFRVAWDLQQVIRYRLAWDRNPEGGIQVHFDEPMKTSLEELAVIKKV